jgi:hypothetical protein
LARGKKKLEYTVLKSSKVFKLIIYMWGKQVIICGIIILKRVDFRNYKNIQVSLLFFSKSGIFCLHILYFMTTREG